ncbi:MAG TPA: metalloregulator ArsR/SmtB family transcription factor [Sphingomonadaceae bacterium]|nr:metalloregulator ArsR/SmtB family transcription factor [Sphingomonadaceae bacterium]
MSSVFDALAHPIRREVLELLKSGGKSAGELASHFDVSKPTMSGHFAKLKAAGLIRGENKAGTITYTLNLSTLEEAVMGFMGRMGVRAKDPGEEGEGGHL